MSSYVSPATSFPQISPVVASASAGATRVSQAIVQPVQAPAPAPTATERAAPPPRPNAIAVSQILMNAESMIASIMGLKAHEVSISVNVGRYEF